MCIRDSREEGRLDDIAAHIRPGDLLVVSFGHNDANRAKAERYVPCLLYTSCAVKPPQSVRLQQA